MLSVMWNVDQSELILPWMQVRGGSKHVGHNAGETGLVAAVEIGAKEAMYPAFEAAKAGLGTKLAEGVIEQVP